MIIITLMFWIFNKEFQLGPQPETIIIIIITIWSLPTLYPFYLSLSTSHSLPPTTYSLSISSLFHLSHIYIPSTLFISLLPTLVLHLYLTPSSHSHSLSFISALLFLCVSTYFYYPLSSLPYLTHPLSLPKLQPTLPSDLLPSFSFHLSSILFHPLPSLFSITPILLFLSTLFSPLFHFKRQRWWCSMVVVFDGVWVLVLSGCLKADLSHHLWPQSGKFWYKNSQTSKPQLGHANNWWLQPQAVCSHTFSGVF